MTLHQIGTLGSIVAVIVFSAACLPWIMDWWSRRVAQDHLPIRRPRYVFDKADESLPAKAALRRAQADVYRRASLRIVSGEGSKP